MATQQEINDAVRLNEIINKQLYGYDSSIHAKRDAADFQRLGGQARFDQLMSDPQVNQHISAGSGNSLVSSLKTAAPYIALGAGAYGLNSLGAFGAGTTAPTGMGAFTAEQLAGPVMSAGAPTLGAGTLGSIGSAMSNADIAAALESGQYGGMTGALTPAEIAAAGGGTSNLGGAASSLIPGIGNNTLGSLISGGAALYAGEQGASAAGDALAEQRRQFDIGQTNMQPWLQAGTKALGAQQDLLGLGTAGGAESQLASLMSTPGYQFRLGQGQKSLEASSAARGGMGSGKAMTGMTQYGQDYASNEYGNRLNQLAGLSGTGQTTATNMANAGQQYGSDAGNSILAANNYRQSGILGAGNALSDWLNPQPKTPTLANLLKGY